VVHPTAPATPNTPATPAGNGAFVASKRSGVFHTATCANGKRIADKNRTAFDSVAAADKAGKKPAKCCNPGK
jgi:methylphosphotriester-DNA--protein-cysteine methyltransferase